MKTLLMTRPRPDRHRLCQEIREARPITGEEPRRLNDGEWAPFGILIGAPSIRPDKSDAERVQRTEEADQDHRRGIAGNRDVAGEVQQDDHEPEDKSEESADQADKGENANRQIGKGEDAVEQIGQLLPEGPGALAEGARAAVITDLGPAKAEPDHESDQGRICLL